MRINIARAAVAGIIGAAVMTVVGLYVAPLMGIPAMNPAVMLAGAMGGVAILGWAAHFMIGITLAVGYAVVGRNLPGAPWASGALYGLAPFLLAQVAVMPMMGMPFFSGFGAMAVGSLVGHLVYGAVVGAVYGGASEAQVVPASA
jgi:uncharacterized membrane protein YagU involved in acid resistance